MRRTCGGRAGPVAGQNGKVFPEAQRAAVPAAEGAEAGLTNTSSKARCHRSVPQRPPDTSQATSTSRPEASSGQWRSARMRRNFARDRQTPDEVVFDHEA